MQSYPKVKTVDAAWLGNIPEQWECKKVRSLFTYRNEKVSDKEFEPLSVSKMGVVPQLETAVKSDAGDNRKLVRAGDFVINSRSDRRGSCGVSDLDGSVTLISIVLEPHSCWSRNFVHYLLRSQPFSEEFFRNGRGIVDDLWTTRYSEMKNILLPVPPRSEQDQIVRYLDWQVSRIDKLIEGKKREIELLDKQEEKLIASCVINGIKGEKKRNCDLIWIKSLPESWKTVKIKRVFQERIEKGFPEECLLAATQNMGVVPKDLYGNRTVEATKDLHLLKLVRVGDFVISLRSFQGGIEYAYYQGIISPAYTIMFPNDSIFPGYFRLLAKSQPFIELLKLCVTGIREGQNIDYQKLKNSLIPHPTLEEQKEIADYLDSQSKKIRSLREKLTETTENYLSLNNVLFRTL